MFLKWLKKVFKMADSDTKTKESSSGAPSSNAPKVPAATSLIDEQRKSKVFRKFELQIFDENLKDDGSTELKPVPMERAVIVEAATPEDLKMILGQYRLCGQVAKIVREIDPPPPRPIAPVQQAQTQVLPAPAQCQPASFPATQPRSEISQVAAVASPAPQLKSKPKIVTIGDMQVKYDGDKIYQKQWVKLNANEAANFRVVSDSSNKIINLTGKHLEARRWIQVKETADDSVDDEVEAILAGE